MEKTLILIKPDAVQRGIAGEIITRFEKKGLKLVGNKMMNLSDDILKAHYAHLADKPFFPRIVEFMQSSPVIAQCWEGKEAVKVVRAMCGVTNSRDAAQGTIRGDLGMSIQCNVIHASEDEKNAKMEVERFFMEDEIFDYEKADVDFHYSGDER